MEVFQAFTRCDPVCAFNGHGKVSAIRFVMKSSVFQSAMLKLGEEWIVLLCELIASHQDFKCRIYAAKATDTKVKSLCNKMFQV